MTTYDSAQKKSSLDETTPLQQLLWLNGASLLTLFPAAYRDSPAAALGV